MALAAQHRCPLRQGTGPPQSLLVVDEEHNYHLLIGIGLEPGTCVQKSFGRFGIKEVRSRAPRRGSSPNCPLEGPPHPPLQLEDPSLKPQPFPPHPLPPSSPHPSGSFCNAPGGRPTLVWGRCPRAQGGGGGGPPSGTWGQTHIWGYSIRKVARSDSRLT